MPVDDGVAAGAVDEGTVAAAVEEGVATGAAVLDGTEAPVDETTGDCEEVTAAVET